ncbi:MAG: hypothetical protein ABSG13_20405 [Bryobacteraceae bacterium]|jgi:uncharacterized protein (TIGR03437 family)
MTPLHRTIFILSSALLMTVTPALVKAQSFDTSGTASLKGQYLFRYVNFFNDQNGNLTESCTLTGAIAFDGAGRYTLSNPQLFDSNSTSGAGRCASNGGGTYGVQSNGIAQLDNPLYPATLFGTFSQPVVIASSTEDGYFDLFIAVQAPSSSFSSSSLSGAFTVGTLDFPNADASLARQGYFTVNADGNGNIAAFTVTGSLQNVKSGETVSQSVAASTYALSGTAGGTLTFPADSGDQTQIVSGAKVLYVSADGNWFVGGSATGSDMLFGFRAPSGTSSNSLLNGTYFTAGMEDLLPTSLNFLDAFYGSINTSGNGTLIQHQRFDDVVLQATSGVVVTYDNTFDKQVTIGADGSYYDGSTYTYLAGANGSALMLIGSNEQFSLIIGIHAPSFTPSSVWINPVGISNAANYTPITNAYAPGELVNLYGTFGVSTQVDQALPISTTLGGVQVFVNGQAAPVYLVSQNQISALIPFEISGDLFATFQVVVNGSKSNLVTVYVDNSAPGIYTATENGVGAGAILHADYSEVTASSPATPGETLQVFMTGLGNVTPEVADGVAAPDSPLSNTVEGISVFLDDGVDFAPAVVSFAGLAPGFAGLYQVNFTVPAAGLVNGDVHIALDTNEAVNEMATISLSGFSGRAAQSVPSQRMSRLAAARSATHGRHAKQFRRALPDR